MTGFVLGFSFPIGVRLVGPTGQWAVQKMWAVNGAASIAGSALAAFIGITFGSRAVLAAGLAAYALAVACGWRALRYAQAQKTEAQSADAEESPGSGLLSA